MSVARGLQRLLRGDPERDQLRASRDDLSGDFLYALSSLSALRPRDRSRFLTIFCRPNKTLLVASNDIFWLRSALLLEPDEESLAELIHTFHHVPIRLCHTNFCKFLCWLFKIQSIQ
uniref:Uncharacterized protein n=1 Tax=Lutzomyia longipalpis TaxID=7200 RepID=A0A7G3B2U7_LUTLO